MPRTSQLRVLEFKPICSIGQCHYGYCRWNHNDLISFLMELREMNGDICTLFYAFFAGGACIQSLVMVI